MSSGVEPAHFSSYNFSMSDALPLTALVESFVEAANPQKQQKISHANFILILNPTPKQYHSITDVQQSKLWLLHIWQSFLMHLCCWLVYQWL